MFNFELRTPMSRDRNRALIDDVDLPQVIEAGFHLGGLFIDHRFYLRLGHRSDLQGKRDIIGGLWVKGLKIHIEDDCENMANQFHSRYTDPDLRLAKSLMIFDLNIPDQPKQLEDRDQVQDLIRAIMPGLMTIY